MKTSEQEKALEVVRIVAEAIREAGTMPSGILYANLMGYMSLGTYEGILGTLKRADRHGGPRPRDSMARRGGPRMSHACYAIVRSDATSVTIRDEGPWDRYLTVTNDAEAVVEELLTVYGLGSRRLFYYDSDGRLDELVIVAGKFAGFRRGPEAPGDFMRPLGATPL